MHRHIGAARHPIPDVPVIYLVEPNAKNLEGITNDLHKGLYSPAYINFLSSIPRPLLEDFAAQTAEKGTAEHIEDLHLSGIPFCNKEVHSKTKIEVLGEYTWIEVTPSQEESYER